VTVTDPESDKMIRVHQRQRPPLGGPLSAVNLGLVVVMADDRPGTAVRTSNLVLHAFSPFS
jgi:hypothetical protein